MIEQGKKGPDDSEEWRVLAPNNYLTQFHQK